MVIDVVRCYLNALQTCSISPLQTVSEWNRETSEHLIWGAGHKKYTWPCDHLIAIVEVPISTFRSISIHHDEHAMFESTESMLSYDVQHDMYSMEIVKLLLQVHLDTLARVIMTPLQGRKDAVIDIPNA